MIIINFFQNWDTTVALGGVTKAADATTEPALPPRRRVSIETTGRGMNTQILATLLARFAQGDLPTAAEVIPLIQDRTTRQALLEYPDLANALAAQAATESGLNCEMVMDALAAYIDAEQAGEDERAHFEPITQHLQRCPLCYEDYTLARDVITAQQAGTISRWPLEAHAGIVLGRAQLNCVLHERAATRQSTWHIFSGNVPDLPDLAATVTLERPAAADTDWRLIVVLGGATAVDLRLMLRYETELRIQRSDATGRAIFPDVPEVWLCTEDGPDLLLLFADDSRASTSEPTARP